MLLILFKPPSLSSDKETAAAARALVKFPVAAAVLRIIL